jgi:hypothetical protein
MYFPKSQIKTDLYTNGGDFTITGLTTPYKGYYYETAKGEYFSGKTPNESPSFKLIRIKPNSLPSNLPEDLQLENLPTENYYVIENGYLKSTTLSFLDTPPLPPKQTYPVLTDDDYRLGEFQRYYLKKSNEPQFLEVSKEEYQKFVIRDNSVLYQLYIPFKINWILTGDKEQVYKTNQGIVGKAERDNNLTGFTSYFKNNFTQFYK